jgi:hypothetical protein
MDENLQQLIDLARGHQITQSEQEAQLRSFAYGNTHIENEEITKADIDRAVSSLRVERESDPDRS